MTTHVVTTYGDRTEIVSKGSGRACPDYHSTFTIDGNSNVTLRWKHGRGEGEVKLPNGLAFNLLPALMVYHAEDGNVFEKTRLFAQIIATWGGRS